MSFSVCENPSCPNEGRVAAHPRSNEKEKKDPHTCPACDKPLRRKKKNLKVCLACGTPFERVPQDPRVCGMCGRPVRIIMATKVIRTNELDE